MWENVQLFDDDVDDDFDEVGEGRTHVMTDAVS